MTYEDQVGRWFSDSCLVAHVTNLVVLGPPDLVRLSLNNGTELADRGVIGPLAEGQSVTLRFVLGLAQTSNKSAHKVSLWNGNLMAQI